MRYNSVVSSHSKSTGIPRVNGLDGLSTGPSDLGRHNMQQPEGFEVQGK